MENKNNLVPIAIVIAGLIIGGALYLRAPATSQPNTAAVALSQGGLEKLDPIDSTEHVLGNANAPIKIVEYSDLECPYCKAFHLAMDDLIAKYSGEQVAWVFRNFPLDRHPKAMPEAVAAECVARLGDNDKYWRYIDQIFATTPSNNGLDLAVLPQFAADLGIDATNFQNCFDNNETKSIIDADYQNGVEIGVDGTPYGIMILPDGQKFLLFRENPLADIDATSAAIINDLSTLYQEQIQKLSQAQ